METETLDSVFEKSPFSINRFFMRFIGLWPLETKSLRKLYFAIVILLMISQAFFQVGGLVAAGLEDDIDSVLELIPHVLLDFTIFADLLFSVINTNKLKRLLKKMYYSWEFFLPEEEIILEQYATASRKMTLHYAYGCYGITLPFLVLPLYPILSNLISVGDDKPLQLVYQVKHFLDVQNYYYFILLHSYFGTLAFMTVYVALDSMFIIFIQHACGMFTALSSRLYKVIPKKVKATKAKDKSYPGAIDCAITHNVIIEFADMIEYVYSYGFLISVGFFTLSISLTAFYAIEYLHMPSTMTRFLFLTIVQIFNLYFKCWQSQMLIDHSALIGKSIYNSNWFETNLKTRKVLSIMLTRSGKLCTLTAGKFFTMSLETFTVVIRRSVSYFTVFNSIR